MARSQQPAARRRAHAPSALASVIASSHNRALARLDAGSHLPEARLPPGAQRSDAEPAGDAGVLGDPGLSQVGNAVDDHAWWVVPGGPDTVDVYVRTHYPRGSRPGESGSLTTSSGQSGLIEGFAWPAVSGELSSRQLVVEMVSLSDGETGVRVDAQDVWITPRPASERIPRSAKRLRVILTRAGQVVAGPFTFTSRRRIDRVAGLINALPGEQPGAFACPADPGYRIRLTFLSGVRQLAVATVNPEGCQEVALTLHGRRQRPLTSLPFAGSGLSVAHPLISQLDRALGLRLGRKLRIG
ncbi:MAG TPA: hypothetical protein VGL51_01855 [Solirubrobacteraceae bacterium]